MNGSTTTNRAGAEHGSPRRTFPPTSLRSASRRLLLAACLTALTAVSATARPPVEPTPPPVPANLEVPEGNRAFLMAHAVGTQNYLCLPRTSGPGLGWSHLGPQATLFDDDLDQIATHFLSVNPIDGFARAAWQHSGDTSGVWAAAIASSTDPAFVTPGAVAWLLLEAKGGRTGLDGDDGLAETTFIQRVNTVEGSAPAGDCPAVGARVFVPYEADYVFYRAR
jgi:hypothetical protein